VKSKSCLSCDNFRLLSKNFCSEHRNRNESKACPNYQSFCNQGDLLRLGHLSKKNDRKK
jgi:hypothetical protein